MQTHSPSAHSSVSLLNVPLYIRKGILNASLRNNNIDNYKEKVFINRIFSAPSLAIVKQNGDLAKTIEEAMEDIINISQLDLIDNKKEKDNEKEKDKDKDEDEKDEDKDEKMEIEVDENDKKKILKIERIKKRTEKFMSAFHSEVYVGGKEGENFSYQLLERPQES